MLPVPVSKPAAKFGIAIFVVMQYAFVSFAASTPPDFTKDVAPIFAKYCAGCHNQTDLDGDLSLANFADLQKGGSRGATIVPGRAEASLLVRVLTGEVEPKMPPEDSERPSDAEIAVLGSWIDAGAKGPEGAEPEFPELSTPEVAAAPNVKEFVTSLALSPDGKRLAIGGYRHVDLLDPETKKVIASTRELPGKINSISFSADGSKFVAASGIPGLYGVATICDAVSGKILQQVKGHRDSLYDARLTPDGKLLATCSYDRQVMLWDVASGNVAHTLSGHNGAVFELAFSPDGKLLASASADDTIKIWSVDTGERLDTLGQPEGSQAAVAISPNGRVVAAAGADRQVRLWQLVSRGKPEVNPLKFSRTAHDSPVVKLVFSPDGERLVTASDSRELMLWDVASLTPIHDYEAQPDVVTGIAFEPGGQAFYVVRIDGSSQRYDVVNDAKPVAEAPAISAPQQVAGENANTQKGKEVEPNNTPENATRISTNAVFRGVIGRPNAAGAPDSDMYRFTATKGQQLVLEINAARSKSPLDSKLEVLDAAGKPVPRVLLQAVRASYFTFRGQDSDNLNDYRLHSWEDMELNEYLYANGEVNKLWLYPRGPDSGFLVYPGFSGPRYSYFGSSALSHALNEPCYIVEAHAPGSKLIPSGLPQFTIYYENDDDGWRKLGKDSRLVFTAPADGDYFVRVSDVRWQGGDKYRYKLTVRAPRPDFAIRLDAPDLTINTGSGKEFTVVADRIDEFDGEIRLEVSELPPGFHASSPVVIQAGQTTAYGVISADAGAPPLTPENGKLAKLKASATINGKEVHKDAVAFGELKLAEKPKIVIRVFPSASDAASPPASAAESAQISLAPGETVSALLKVERNGFNDDITFGKEFSGRNLPHGVYVDNIGLNGITLLSGETERKIFITAAKWVPETTRAFHLRADQEGNQTSWPVLLHVRQSSAESVSRNQVAAATDEND